jgi:predicted RNA-binding protein with RPS1 domain
MNMPKKNASDNDEKSSLSYSEAVADARMRASDERHQISKHARDGFNGLGNSFPTFWSADRQTQLKAESNCTGAQNRGITLT